MSSCVRAMASRKVRRSSCTWIVELASDSTWSTRIRDELATSAASDATLRDCSAACCTRASFALRSAISLCTQAVTSPVKGTSRRVVMGEYSLVIADHRFERQAAPRLQREAAPRLESRGDVTGGAPDFRPGCHSKIRVAY